MTTIEFRAPWGRTVRVRTAIGLVMLAGIVLSALLTQGAVPMPFTIVMIGLPPLIVAAALARCVRGYTLTEEAITMQSRAATGTRRSVGTARSQQI